MFAGLGIILIVAGAIITFAIEREAEGVDLRAIGYIMMAGGVDGDCNGDCGSGGSACDGDCAG